MKSKLEIYALTVCFAAVVCLVVSAGIAGYAAFRIATPELTLSSYNYDKFQTNEAFWKSRGDSCSDEKTTEVRPGEEVLTKQRLEAFSLELKGERREGWQSIIGSLIFILVSGVALLIHWKIAQQARMPGA